MKDIDNYIQEKLRINQDTKVVKQEYTCQPKDWENLRSIIEERLGMDKNADLNDIDVSKITDMHNLFYKLNPYDIKIDKWNVSNVKNMSGMFYGCIHFNCNLSEWDVSNVETMLGMFYGCKSLKNTPSWYKEQFN